MKFKLVWPKWFYPAFKLAVGLFFGLLLMLTDRYMREPLVLECPGSDYSLLHLQCGDQSGVFVSTTDWDKQTIEAHCVGGN